MEDFLDAVVGRFLGRLSGPLRFRFLLQPLIASVIAVIDGVRDARKGRPAYFWAVCTDSMHRRFLLREGWKSIIRVFVGATVIDLIYQIWVLHSFRPIGALIVAALLALLPYILVRGPVNRLVSRWVRR